MSITLLISNVLNAGQRYRKRFDQDFITIGRDISNALHLKDTRKMVSRHHAELKRKADSWYLIDNESVNSTFLNGRKVTSNRAYRLQNGDRIKIGSFIIKFIGSGDVEEDEAEIENPFSNESRSLTDLLDRIEATFRQGNADQRKALLRHALDDVFKNLENPELREIFIHAIDSGFQPNGHAAEGVANGHADVQQLQEINSLVLARMEKVVELLIRTVSHMRFEADRFRSEFVGIADDSNDVTQMIPPTQRLVASLVNPNASRIETARQLSGIEDRLEEIVLHQRAMMNGFRASVVAGFSQVAERMDPERIEHHVNTQTVGIGPLRFPMRLIPFYTRLKSYEILKRGVNMMIDKGEEGIDRHVLRANFIDAYIRTINHGNGHPEENNEF